MLAELRISDRVTNVCLLRLEKTGIRGASLRSRLIERLGSELQKKFSGSGHRLDEQFRTLGGGSSAMFISTDSLDNTAVIKEIINTTLNSIVGESDELDSEVLAFPVARLKTETQDKDFPIPIVVFLRTQKPLASAKWLLKIGELVGTDVMLGYGSHSLIFRSKCPSLSGIRETVNKIAQLFGEGSRTYTVIGIPQENRRHEEKQLSGPRFPFHTAMKVEVTIPDLISEIQRVMTEFSHLFKGLSRGDFLGFSPGQMDLTVNYRAAYISESYDFVRAIGDLEGVIDTVTWPDFHTDDTGGLQVAKPE